MSEFASEYESTIDVESVTAEDDYGKKTYAAARQVACKIRSVHGGSIRIDGVIYEAQHVIKCDELVELDDRITLPDGTQHEPQAVASSSSDGTTVCRIVL